MRGVTRWTSSRGGGLTSPTPYKACVTTQTLSTVLYCTTEYPGHSSLYSLPLDVVTFLPPVTRQRHRPSLRVGRRGRRSHCTGPFTAFLKLHQSQSTHTHEHALRRTTAAAEAPVLWRRGLASVRILGRRMRHKGVVLARGIAAHSSPPLRACAHASLARTRPSCGSTACHRARVMCRDTNEARHEETRSAQAVARASRRRRNGQEHRQTRAVAEVGSRAGRLARGTHRRSTSAR